MIRRARQTDFSRVCEIYAIARAFMVKTGNATQWGDSFPPEELLREDIRLGRLYVVEEAGNVHGAFAFLLGEDPTYQVIEGGAWKSEPGSRARPTEPSTGWPAAGRSGGCLDRWWTTPGGSFPTCASTPTRTTP